MGELEINAFLTYLALSEKASASAQNQALSALSILYPVFSTGRSATSATSSAPSTTGACLSC